MNEQRPSNPSNDLVSRLRDPFSAIDDMRKAAREAADELERLTRERDEAQKLAQFNIVELHKGDVERDRLRAQVAELLKPVNEDEGYERLRAALEWAIQECARCDNAAYAAHIAETLREALRQEK